MPISWLAAIFWYSRVLLGGAAVASVFTLAAGIYYVNLGVAWGLLAAILAWLFWILGNVLFRSAVFGDGDLWVSRINNSGRLSFWILAYFAPSFLVFWLSAFVFCSTESTAYFVHERNTASHPCMLAIPFWEDIRSVRVKHEFREEVQAITKDGKRVKGYLHATVRPVLPGHEFQNIVLTEHDPDHILREDLLETLRQKLKSGVAQLRLSELHYNLLWSWEGEATGDKPLRTPLGVEWEGCMQLSGLTVYFGDD